MKELSSSFLQSRLPLTTSRLPRNLLQYKKFKATELRILLLFVHIIFSQTLNEVYYSHLLRLIVLMHMAEAKQILPQHLPIIQQLSHSFVLHFAKLYTVRHCVQTVYSLSHRSVTVKDF